MPSFISSTDGKARGNYPVLASRLPGLNYRKVGDSGSVWFLFSIISRERMKTIKHDALIWAGRQPWTAPCHGPLCRKGPLWEMQACCELAPLWFTLVPSSTHVTISLIHLNPAGHIPEEVFLQFLSPVILCPISTSLLSGITWTHWDFLVTSSLDCKFWLPHTHCRPGKTWSREGGAQSILSLTLRLLTCPGEDVICFWGTSSGGLCPQCPLLHMFPWCPPLKHRTQTSSSPSPCSKKIIKDHMCILWRLLGNEDHHPYLLLGQTIP